MFQRGQRVKPGGKASNGSRVVLADLYQHSVYVHRNQAFWRYIKKIFSLCIDVYVSLVLYSLLHNPLTVVLRCHKE